MPRRLALAAALVLTLAAAGLALAGPAVAATKLATYETAGCSTGPVWRIGYRMYFQDSAGRATSRAATAAALAELRLFVDSVGEDSACGIRVLVDAFDMDGAVWPVSPSSAEKPADTADFLAAGAYDSTFNRFPANGEGYCANTNVGLAGSFARFPVDADGRLGCSMGGPDCLCEPWEVLLLHEWLHQVVAFYEPERGWPSNDVHGACEHGYSTNCNTFEPYFADMMQGLVPEAGGLRGMQPAEWAQQGTPAQPVRAVAATTVTADTTGTVEVNVPADLGVPVTVTTQDFQTFAPGSAPLTFDPPQLRFELPDGLWFVCLRFAGSPKYRGQDGCDQTVFVQRSTAPGNAPAPAPVHVPVTPPAGVTVGRLPSVEAPHEPVDPAQSAKPQQRPRFVSLQRRGRTIRVASRRIGTQPLVLLARRGATTRVIRGSARGTLVRFSARLSRGSWRLRLRSGEAGPAAVHSTVRVVRIG